MAPPDEIDRGVSPDPTRGGTGEPGSSGRAARRGASVRRRRVGPGIDPGPAGRRARRAALSGVPRARPARHGRPPAVGWRGRDRLRRARAGRHDVPARTRGTDDALCVVESGAHPARDRVRGGRRAEQHSVQAAERAVRAADRCGSDPAAGQSASVRRQPFRPAAPVPAHCRRPSEPGRATPCPRPEPARHARRRAGRRPGRRHRRPVRRDGWRREVRRPRRSIRDRGRGSSRHPPHDDRAQPDQRAMLCDPDRAGGHAEHSSGLFALRPAAIRRRRMSPCGAGRVESNSATSRVASRAR